QDWSVASGLWGVRFTVPIPLGALIPQGYDGLMAAGRCLAVDHDMAACVRMKRDMQQCGEGAANAAFLSITQGVPLRDVPYADLARLQAESGCLPAAPGEQGVSFDYWTDASKERVKAFGPAWLESFDEIK